MTPIIRSLSTIDFAKVLAACKSHAERRPYIFARNDSEFEFHIDLHPGEGAEPNQTWIHDEKRFPDE